MGLISLLKNAWKRHEVHYAEQDVKDLKVGIHRVGGEDPNEFRMVEGQEQAFLLEQAEKRLSDLTHS